MKVVVVGTDPDRLGAALEARGAEVSYAEGTGARPALEDAGVVEADLLVLTEAELATSIPVAKDLNPDLRVVAYARDSLPEFVKGQAGHIVDPRLLSAEAVAEELV
jgi:Trk K+ transport system NAD-binding subunit